MHGFSHSDDERARSREPGWWIRVARRRAAGSGLAGEASRPRSGWPAHRGDASPSCSWTSTNMRRPARVVNGATCDCTENLQHIIICAIAPAAGTNLDRRRGIAGDCAAWDDHRVWARSCRSSSAISTTSRSSTTSPWVWRRRVRQDARGGQQGARRRVVATEMGPRAWNYAAAVEKLALDVRREFGRADLGLVSATRDIVAAVPKMPTRSDQAHEADLSARLGGNAAMQKAVKSELRSRIQPPLR